MAEMYVRRAATFSKIKIKATLNWSTKKEKEPELSWRKPA